MPSNHFPLIIFQIEWPLPIIIARRNLIKLNFKSRQSIQTNRSERCSFPKTKLIKSWESGKEKSIMTTTVFALSPSPLPLHPSPPTHSHSCTQCFISLGSHYSSVPFPFISLVSFRSPVPPRWRHCFAPSPPPPLLRTPTSSPFYR